VLASTGSAFGGVIGFIIWILIMVWIYNIAKRKGRHALGWLILGFFFSIISLIVLLVLPSKRITDAAR
jgi:Na+/melibiose symporter-like transporter